MAELFLKADTTLNAASESAKQHSRTFLFPLEEREGYAFALLSIATNRGDAEPAFQLIEERLQRLVQSCGPTTNIQHRFEQFLSALNERIAQEVKEGRWHIPVKAFNGTIGVTDNQEMYLSGTGDVTVLFLHNQPAENSYRVFNLSRSIRTEQAMPDWKKIFAVVLDGDLHAGDVLCISDQELQRKVDAQELNTALAKLPPAGAVEKLRQRLAKERPLALMAIKAESPETAAEEERAAPLSNQSVEALEKTKAATEETLSDRSPKLKKWLKNLFSRAPSTKKQGILRAVIGVLFIVFGVAGRLVLGIAQRMGAFFLLLFNREDRKRVARSTERTLKHHTQRFRRGLKHLPHRSKKLLAAGVALLFVFSVSVGVLARSKARQAQLDTYNQQINTVEETIDRAEGAVIYKDEEQARTLYLEAETDLSELAAAPTERQGRRVGTLRERIDAGLNDVRHIVSIDTPEKTADMQAIGENQQPVDLVAFGPDLFVFTNETGVYRVDRTNQILTRLNTTDGEVGVPRRVTAGETRVLFLDDRPGISSFDAETDQLQITELGPSDSTTWQSVALYAERLYVLETDARSGRIIRYNQAGNGFGSGSSWIQSKTVSLEHATDLTIDGSIFVLTSTGDIVQFFRGIQQNWEPGVIDPALEQPTRIWTDADSSYLYLLDPPTGRLVVLSKEDGSLVVQYTSDVWSDLYGFVVNENLSLAQLLTPEGVYKIDLTHLD